jgi:putative ABC transport system permease protein
MYRALLRLYPASFRAEYGAEMRAVFARRRRDATGPLSLAFLWLEAAADVLWNAARVHAELLAQDLRYAARSFRNAPGFTATVVLVAALGVGVTTAAFSVTDHVLVRPLPFAEPDQLVRLWQSEVRRGYSRSELSPANYRDWRRLAAASFEETAVWRNLALNLSGTGDPERLDGCAVSASLFPLLGVQPLLGRGFAPEDDSAGAPGTVVLGYRLWQDRFGGDPGVLGRRLALDGASYEVVGVMPRDFRFPTREVEFWTATRFPEQAYEDRTDTYLYAIARLRRGVTLDQARAELGVAAAQLERAYPLENAHVGAAVFRLRDEVAPQARLLLTALLAAAFCVLLIACTNLASLLLARALVRRQELAVRTALGAGRERLLRQLLTESGLLAVLGGALGVAFAFAATPLLARLVPTALPIAEAPGVDLRVLAFAALMTVAIAVGFGVAPAWRALRDVDAAGLRENARGGVGGRRERLRGALVLAEVTLSVALLASTGLLIRALARVQAVEPGFRADGVLTLRTALPLPRYNETATRHRFYADVLAGVRALPGVEGAAYTSFLPMVMRGGIWKVQLPGDAPQDDAKRASLRFVTPGYFDTLGIPLRAGRDVTDGDRVDAPFVAVVSDSFAREHWPGQDPLGRRFRLAFFERTVVGVVGDVRVRGLERASEPQVYVPDQQVPDGGVISYAPKDLAVRTAGDPAALVPAIRRVVAQADPQQPISDVRTMADVLREETGARTVQARVLGAFAAAALLLAAVGIHGLLSFVVRSRAQEIGVRVALGARPRDVLLLVLRGVARLTAGGLGLGLLLASAGARALQSLLFGVSPYDGATLGAAAAVAALTALSGGLLPALRALRVDPLRVMRAE